MSDDMNEKYQQYYNQILTGTLTDTILKGVSYQANIKLANEIIGEQDKTVKDLQDSNDSLKKDLESIKSDKSNSENVKISELENNIKSHLNTISGLNNSLAEMNKFKSEYENVKHQVQHMDTFRNELVKERDEHQKTRSVFENKIKELTEKIEYLQLTPAQRKKVDAKKNVTLKVAEPMVTQAKIIKQDPPGLILKDGGSF